MTTGAEIRLIGGFALVLPAGRTTVAESLQRLLAFLALRGPTPRTAIAGTLWPGTCDDRSMASLRTAVWRLRRLAPGLLVGTPGTLEVSPVARIDVTRLAEFAGPAWPNLLPGWYDDWVVMERERLRHRYLRMLEAAAATAIDSGQPAVALDRALAAAAADPLRESAHRLVIRALLTDGNLAAARRHLGLVRVLFREQLGVAPTDQLTDLFRPMQPVA
ncbi:AfsR/SARP family transcriptional regulator [Paractinoplanes toevensis]|uniref:AfsR/SARP family transcriptional regulator n=1 Tax=Paractinoplanes toevensis TaxID=571911 RepID=UPI001BB40A27|nr:BTAD domain-containing putative transcriptional regulator [Actinoplanes toevensis]